MKRALTSIVLVVSTSVTYAGPRNILVLKAEGTADTSTRTSIETHVLKLAKKLDGKVDAGDITLSDAAAAAGCNISDTTCKDEILATFAVDELVATSANTNAAGTSVTVRRITKGSPPKTLQATLASSTQLDKLDTDLGPLFGVAAAAPTPPAPATTPPPTTTTPPPTTTTVTTSPTAPPLETSSVLTAQPPPNEAPTYQHPDTAQWAPSSSGPVDTGPPHRTWQKIGMGAGAGMAVLGVVLWAAASSKQDDIDNAPHDTPADFKKLTQLESDADGLAGGGNLFFVTGVALAGVSGYFYWRAGREHRSSSSTARLSPSVFPHGGGVVLTFGGDR